MDSEVIFETNRLVIRPFYLSDELNFFDMMGNPNVMNPIPLKALSQQESSKTLKELLNLYHLKSDKKIWAVNLKKNTEMIGLCGMIINNENENEIAYRFREKFWGFGYGTEITKGLIDYGFNELSFKLITADAYILNKKSIKIIEKFMVFNKEFYNQDEKCTDRRYKLTKKKWLSSKS